MWKELGVLLVRTAKKWKTKKLPPLPARRSSSSSINSNSSLKTRERRQTVARLEAKAKERRISENT